MLRFPLLERQMGCNIFGFLAALGFLASVASHILGWLEIDPPGGKAVFALHIGIFLVVVPLIALIARHSRQPQGRTWKLSDPPFNRMPNWANILLGILFGYAIVHFFVFLAEVSRHPKGKAPLYLEVRGFSGHWMLFYGFGVLAFLALIRFRRENVGNNLERTP